MCLQTSPFESMILCLWAIPRNKIGRYAQENIFLLKIPKILRVLAQDVPCGMKSVRLMEMSTCQRLVNADNLNYKTHCQRKLIFIV